MRDDCIIVVILTLPDGTKEIEDATTGEVIALKLKGGTVADLRQHPPFLAMDPCPYCGARNNKVHTLSMHVDPFLGTINSEK